jgi:uncharacterized protein (DUF58 family)
MRPTRRSLALFGLAIFLVVLGALSDRLFPIVGGAMLGAYLLAEQYAAVRSFTAAEDDLTVTLDADVVGLADDEVPVRARLDLDHPTTAAIDVEIAPPVSGELTSGDAITLGLTGTETTAAESFGLVVPFAGRFDVPPAEVQFTDRRGLFIETIEYDVDATVTVEARTPNDVHVGQGGEQTQTVHGEHPTGRKGAGLLPEEIREYVTGDSAARIDWNATARMGEPYVQEFEVETDRQTVLVVDHRSTMGTGPTGRTMFDYAREFGLGVVLAAEEANDVLGLYTVGNEGITTARTPQNDPQSYETIRGQLQRLQLTPGNGTPTSPSGTTTPAEAVRRRTRLESEETEFAHTLRPYFDAADPYTHRVGSDPLYETVKHASERVSGSLWSVLVTDDTGRERVREAAKHAARHGGRAVVCLTPTVLFEEGGLTDLESAYERYVRFEEFRRELETLPRVRAFELGPGDRLEALLATRRSRGGSR